MAFTDVARPLEYATPADRVDYLKRVLLVTAGGLSIAAVVGIVSTFVIALVPPLQNQIAQIVIILGGFGVANYVAPRMVFGSAKWPGFFLGMTAQGVAMGYLLLAAVMVSGATQGNPFFLIGAALALTAMTAFGMTAYVWSNPREFKMLGAGLAALGLPMLILMGVSFVFPSLFGGVIGIVLSAVFVAVSAAGLLYQINKVMHQLSTDQHVEGAYLIALGILVLFWNILTLLMRLSSRD